MFSPVQNVDNLPTRLSSPHLFIFERSEVHYCVHDVSLSVAFIQQSCLPQSGRQKILRAMGRERAFKWSGQSHLICEAAQYSNSRAFLLCRALIGVMPPITVSFNFYHTGTLLEELYLFLLAIGNIMYVLARIYSTVQYIAVLLQRHFSRGRRPHLIS